ncbi:MAG TPA: SDR family oxidoreductase [Bacteroidales bacterium]|nr:SDR family oxidoreductase [Bacteroidales bacterium]
MIKTNYTLITGASGGIGLELARLAAENRQNLVLVARSGDKLEKLAEEIRTTNQVEVKTLVSDLSKTKGIEEVLSAISNWQITIETLINNAGFGNFGNFASAELDKSLDMIRLNITALSYLTHHFLRDMVKSGHGKIMNVASTASFMPGPGMAVYYASKAYVLSFSEALAREVKGTGVTVTALCPGPTDTGFAETAGLGNSLLHRMLPPATAAEVARVGYKAMLKGKTLVVPGFMNTLSSITPRFLPRPVVRDLIYNIHKRH